MIKLMISLSVAVFALAMMANIQYALDGYGVNNSNLHAQVLAQSTRTGGYDGDGTGTNGNGNSQSGLNGPRRYVEVHCVGSGLQIVTAYANGQTSNGWWIGGGVSGSYGYVGANLNAKYNSASGSGSGDTTTTYSFSHWDFYSYRIECTYQNYTECTCFNPC